MTVALLQVRDLCVAYPEGGPVVRGFDLDVRDGEGVGLVGASGAGKTTIGLVLAGLAGWNRARVDGEVSWRGQVLGAKGLARLRGREIAYLPQEPRAALNPFRTCGSQVREALRPGPPRPLRRRRRDDRQRVARLLERVGLSADVAGAPPHRLSGGMCQRVLLAAALAGEPALLVADEPTASLDTVNRRRVLDLLVGLRNDLRLALVLVSHDRRAVDDVCDRVVDLGECHREGGTASLADSPRSPLDVATR